MNLFALDKEKWKWLLYNWPFLTALTLLWICPLHKRMHTHQLSLSGSFSIFLIKGQIKEKSVKNNFLTSLNVFTNILSTNSRPNGNKMTKKNLIRNSKNTLRSYATAQDPFKWCTITQIVPIIDTGKSLSLTLFFRYGFNCPEYQMWDPLIYQINSSEKDSKVINTCFSRMSHAKGKLFMC